jgi:UDP-3-O-[3-hydroxymyristoyl] glucosamine N-acyltransferase
LKPIAVKEIAKLLNGSIIGDADRMFNSVSKIDQSIPGSLAFLANPKYEHHLYSTTAGVILINKQIEINQPIDATIIQVDDAYSSFCEVLNVYFNTYSHKTGIEAGAYVHASAQLGKDVYIGSGAYVSANVKIGDNVKIYPNSFVGENCKIGNGTVFYAGVKVYHDCVIGQDCIVHAGVVIGSDGFGHAPQKDGTYIKIPQIGNVIIEDKVEIGANSAIDRATLGSTIIKSGVKLDNFIQVAHNVEIGENTVIAAHTGISGSVKLGKNCIIGGQVGFVGHITVADKTQIGAQSGISKDISDVGMQWIGSPIMPLREAFKTQVIYRNLPKLKSQIEALEKELEALKNQVNG